MLRASELRKRFGAVEAVRGVSFVVPRGCVFGLLGPNGAGKSTTIHMVLGQITPDSGGVVLGDEAAGVSGPPDSAAVRRLIGVCPQTLAVYDALSARENIEFFGSMYGLRGRALRERADEVLARVGLLERAGDRAGGFSGGMKRRLNLAAAIVHQPPLVLLDEPTAGVDPQSRANILDLVRDLGREGAAVIYTTHYMEEAQRLCDAVAIMDHGRILAEGTVAELIASHGGVSTLTVTTDAGEERTATADPLPALRELHQRPEVRSVRIDRPDLESVFLAITGRSLRD